MLKHSAKVLKTKYVSSSYEGIDEMINCWLKSNPEVLILDIKFSSGATKDEWGTEALIIYTEIENTES